MTHPTLQALRDRKDRALAAGNNAELRALLEDGATFASLTIQQSTERAEREFARWVQLGRPADLGRVSGALLRDRNRRLSTVRGLADFQVRQLARTGSPQAEQLFDRWVWGYGPAKASFALACAGFGTLGCLDSRLQRKHALVLQHLAEDLAAKDWAAVLRRYRWPGYLAALELLWPGGDSASGQWAEWLEDLKTERYATDHAILDTRQSA